MLKIKNVDAPNKSFKALPFLCKYNTLYFITEILQDSNLKKLSLWQSWKGEILLTLFNENTNQKG